MKRFIRVHLLLILVFVLVMTGCTKEQLEEARKAGVDTAALQMAEETPEGDSQAEESDEPSLPVAGEGRVEADLSDQEISTDQELDAALDRMVDNIEGSKEEVPTGLDAIKAAEEDAGEEGDAQQEEVETPLLDAALDAQDENPEGASDERAGAAESEQEAEAPEAAAPAPASGGGRLVVIDPGHQRKANLDKEPIGPGATETKMKVSGGTSGRTSGLAEYELTLTVSQKLRSILQSRGYTVIMTRESHDVNISNSERAAVANNAGADVFIRIHANGSDNTAVSGAMTLCQTASNPYNANIADQSYSLSQKVLDGIIAKCGCASKGVSRVDNMSGINWSKVPVTIVEMGFMTNPQEDMLMASSDYQQKLAEGMADGIDAYFR